MPVPGKIDEEYLAYVRGHECAGQWLPEAANCMSGRMEAHHIDGRGAESSKRDDRKTVPLCRAHHQEFHDRGQIGSLPAAHTKAVFAADALRLLLAYMDRGEPSKIFHQPEEAF